MKKHIAFTGEVHWLVVAGRIYNLVAWQYLLNCFYLIVNIPFGVQLYTQI